LEIESSDEENENISEGGFSMKNWKKALRQECSTFVPNQKQEILHSLGIITPTKPHFKIPTWRFAGIMTLFILSLIMIIVGSTPRVAASSLVTIDINPSIELEVNSNNQVKSIRALNVDGALLLFDSQDNMVGESLDQVLEIIVQLAEEAGYLSDAETIQIVATNDTNNIEEQLRDHLREYLNQYKIEKGVNFNFQVNDITQEYQNMAQEYNVSIGMMMMIARAQIQNPLLETQDAIKLTPKQLNEMAKEYHQDEIELFVESLQSQLSSFKNKQKEALEVSKDAYTSQAIYEKYQVQVNAYKNEMRETIKQHGKIDDVNFEFDDQFEEEDFPTLPMDDIDVKDLYLLMIRIKTTINSHRGKFSPWKLQVINDMYQEYEKKLEFVSEEIQQSEQITQFELFYQNFLENFQN